MAFEKPGTPPTCRRCALTMTPSGLLPDCWKCGWSACQNYQILVEVK